MTDFLIEQDQEGQFDVSLDGNDFAIDDGLGSAIFLSLFTNARADAQDVLPDNTMPKQGWWGDTFADVPNDKFGSKLWLYRRSKLTTATLENIQQETDAALQWLVADGLAQSINSIATREGEYLGLEVQIEQLDIATPQSLKFKVFWSQNAT